MIRFLLPLLIVVTTQLSLGQSPMNFTRDTSRTNLPPAGRYTVAFPNGKDGYITDANGNRALLFTTATKKMAELRAMPGKVAQELPQVVTTTDPLSAGQWQLDIVDKSSVDNGGTIIRTTDGVCYKRIFNGPEYLDWFLSASAADDSPAIQKALNDAFASRIKVVKVRKDYYDLLTPITIPIGVVLEGDVAKPTYKSVQNADIDSPTLNIRTAQNVNTPAVTLLYNAGIKNFTFYWPLQLKTNTTPIPYGWAITTNGIGSNGDGLLIENITLTNAYKGINIDYGGQWDIRNIKGQCLHTGIQLDRVFDASRLTDIHFWDFWAGAGDPIKPYILANAEAIRIGRVDGLQANNIFVWGHKNMLHFFYANHDDVNVLESGACWGEFNNVKSDICTVPIQIDRSHKIQINNLSGTSADITDGHSLIETGPDVSGSVNVSNVTAFHTNSVANITSTTGSFKFTNVTGQRRGDANDISGYKIINQASTNFVYVDEADYNDVCGYVQVGSHVRFNSDEDITASLPGFADLKAWNLTSTAVTPITNGFRFNLNVTGGTVNRYELPASFFARNAVYVLECDLQLNNPANLGGAHFYGRLSDRAVNDVILPSSPTRAFFVSKTHVRIPLIARRAGMVFDFVFGNANAACTMDMTNLRLYRVGEKNLTQSLVDWLNVKQPNALGDPGIQLARRQQINTNVSMDIELDNVGVVTAVSNTPLTFTIITAKSKRGDITWIHRYDNNQATAITVKTDAGQIQDASGTFVATSMNFPSDIQVKALGFYSDGTNIHCIRSY